MWSKEPCPKYSRVWITVNGVVHPAMYDGLTWRTPNGDYTQIVAWMQLVAPDPYLAPVTYSDDMLIARVKERGPCSAADLRRILYVPKAGYNKLYKKLNHLADSGKIKKQGSVFYAHLP